VSAIPSAPILAAQLLEPVLPDRYAHVMGVASSAAQLADLLGISPHPLVSAAWLHDIGYAPALVGTKFHPIDGARYLARSGCDAEVVRLVAFHSGARVEAKMRGLLDTLLAEFDEPDPDELALLTYCDLTTGPQGQEMTVDERLADIRERYASNDVVHRSIRDAEPELRRSIRAVEMRLRAAQSQ
jgi:putative nucleotidyltransferase with HDIG domain